jgi:hypothetical protein
MRMIAQRKKEEDKEQESKGRKMDKAGHVQLSCCTATATDRGQDVSTRCIKNASFV